MMGAPGGGRAHLHRLLAQEGGEFVLILVVLKDREAAQNTTPVSCQSPGTQATLWRVTNPQPKLEGMSPRANDTSRDFSNHGASLPAQCIPHCGLGVREGSGQRTRHIKTTVWTVYVQVAGKARCQDDTDCLR
jgi:hypothetical protein